MLLMFKYHCKTISFTALEQLQFENLYDVLGMITKFNQLQPNKNIWSFTLIYLQVWYWLHRSTGSFTTLDLLPMYTKP